MQRKLALYSQLLYSLLDGAAAQLQLLVASKTTFLIIFADLHSLPRLTLAGEGEGSHKLLQLTLNIDQAGLSEAPTAQQLQVRTPWAERDAIQVAGVLWAPIFLRVRCRRFGSHNSTMIMPDPTKLRTLSSRF